MAGDKQDGEGGIPATHEESGAGYGNNALSDDIGQPDDDEDASDKPED